MSPFDALREPAHTGEHRCWPCTLVNLALVGVGALLAGRRRRALGLLLAIAGGIAVSVRGYVVPYTPRFAPRLVAASPLPDGWFGHPSPGRTPVAAARPTEPADGLGGDPDGEQLLSRLVEAGVLVADGDAVEPAPEFRDAWDAEMASLSALSTPALADAVLEAARAADVSVVDGTRRDWVVLDDGSDGIEGESWLSRPVAVAEAAAVRALDGWLDDPATRRAAAGPLCVFLTDCPDCDEPLVESTTMNCCGGAEDPLSEPDDVLACPDCDARLHTFEA